MPKSKKITVKLSFDKSTAGAHRFNEVNAAGNTVKPGDADAVVGTLYVRKTALADAPKTLRVERRAGMD